MTLTRESRDTTASCFYFAKHGQNGQKGSGKKHITNRIRIPETWELKRQKNHMAGIEKMDEGIKIIFPWPCKYWVVVKYSL